MIDELIGYYNDLASAIGDALGKQMLLNAAATGEGDTGGGGSGDGNGSGGGGGSGDGNGSGGGGGGDFDTSVDYSAMMYEAYQTGDLAGYIAAAKNRNKKIKLTGGNDYGISTERLMKYL
jgi:hypothetical protein